jgi:FkbH-like protein
METHICLDIQQLDLSEPVATAILAQVPDDQLPQWIDALLARTPGYNRSILEACLATLELRDMVRAAALTPYLAPESPWRQHGAGAWLVARLLELRGEQAATLTVWNQIISREVGPLHEAYLARARLHSRANQMTGAFADLRRALINQSDQRFLSKAARLFARLRRDAVPPAVRTIRLALLASTTTEMIAPLLQLACFRDGIDAELYIAPYGTIQQESLNPASNCYSFKPDIVVIATHWRDAHLPGFASHPEDAIARVVGELSHLWETLLQRHACHIIQHNFDLPASDAYGHLSRALPGGRGHMLRKINEELLAAAPPAVTILDQEQISAQYGKAHWFDAAYWYAAKQHPAADALPLLIDQQVALIRATLGLTRKVLVLDLDNTLWGGVIGEDGLAGIRPGPPSRVGEAHRALQQYAAELKERGILLAVCSKNNAADARLPFLQHDAMHLQLEDFVAFQANWHDKPTNLRTIARQLNLGIDSLVFLDDNPVERALVRRELPEVAVPEAGSDPATYITALERGRYFETLNLSPEDRVRHQSYRANLLRDTLKTEAASLEDFLYNLDMEAEHGPFSEQVLARVVQLIGKTNQFNLTTRRHTEAEIRRMLASSACWTHYFKLKDRFGDNGLVGVMIAHHTPADRHTWEIDTWLMSCRVIGRQMEQFMLQVLVEEAQAAGIEILRGVYIPTAKNAMVADLYPRLGFVTIGQLGNGIAQYVLDLTTYISVPSAFIHAPTHAICH